MTFVLYIILFLLFFHQLSKMYPRNWAVEVFKIQRSKQPGFSIKTIHSPGSVRAVQAVDAVSEGKITEGKISDRLDDRIHSSEGTDTFYR